MNLSKTSLKKNVTNCSTGVTGDSGLMSMLLPRGPELIRIRFCAVGATPQKNLPIWQLNKFQTPFGLDVKSMYGTQLRPVNIITTSSLQDAVAWKLSCVYDMALCWCWQIFTILWLKLLFGEFSCEKKIRLLYDTSIHINCAWGTLWSSCPGGCRTSLGGRGISYSTSKGTVHPIGPLQWQNCIKKEKV